MPNPQLPGIFHTLEPVLNNYGYLAVGGFVTLEDFGVPVPGETILIAAAVYAGAGRLNIIVVVVVAFVAAVVGDNIGFLIGHLGGRPLALRWGRYVFLTPERLDKAHAFFERHGGKVVAIARFIEGLRQANGIIAGITKMPWLKFLAFNALGAALWVGLWATVGYTAGGHINSIYGQLSHYELYLGIAIVVLILAFIARKMWGRRNRRRASDLVPTDPHPQGSVIIGSAAPTADHTDAEEVVSDAAPGEAT